MSDTRDRIQENYGWTAYMKLKGQTRARREKDILDEFDGFVQSLRGANVDYHLIVMVEGGVLRQLRSEYMARDTDSEVVRESSGA